MKNKILKIIPNKDIPENPIKKLLNDLQRDKQYLFELQQLEAEFKRNKFNYLIENGFTEDQAIEFCKGNCLLI